MKNQTEIESAKASLDSIIAKSRALFYKPIQIAEILYKARTGSKIDIQQLETYRSESKRWRDEICKQLLNRCCSSSAKFQDDLFRAISANDLATLNSENINTGGAVEAYIYKKFTEKQNQLVKALNYCKNTKPADFSVKKLMDSFWKERGLKRSLDKVYEIIVYALFSVLANALKLTVEVSVDRHNIKILTEFSDFAQKVMCIDLNNTKAIAEGRLFRVGVTNAADRGLDMYANWGPVVQIKHLTLDEKKAEDIVEGISSDRIIIVCKDAESKVICSLLTQIGWKSKIQSIILENDLVTWYEKALRGKYSSILAHDLLECICNEMVREFPSISSFPDVLKSRQYDKISNQYWLG